MPQATQALQGVSAQGVKDDGSSADDRVRGFVRRLRHGWLRTTEITKPRIEMPDDRGHFYLLRHPIPDLRDVSSAVSVAGKWEKTVLKPSVQARTLSSQASSMSTVQSE